MYQQQRYFVSGKLLIIGVAMDETDCYHYSLPVWY